MSSPIVCIFGINKTGRKTVSGLCSEEFRIWVQLYNTRPLAGYLAHFRRILSLVAGGNSKHSTNQNIFERVMVGLVLCIYSVMHMAKYRGFSRRPCWTAETMEQFCMKIYFISRGEKMCCFCPPTWLP